MQKKEKTKQNKQNKRKTNNQQQQTKKQTTTITTITTTTGVKSTPCCERIFVPVLKSVWSLSSFVGGLGFKLQNEHQNPNNNNNKDITATLQNEFFNPPPHKYVKTVLLPPNDKPAGEISGLHQQFSTSRKSVQH